MSPVRFTLSVTKPIDDTVHYVRFQNATDTSMNLEENIPVSGDNPWWPCLVGPPFLFLDCGRFAPGTNGGNACVNIADMKPVSVTLLKY